MGEIAKIRQYTILKDVSTTMTITKAFDCPLPECVHANIERHKRIGIVFEDDYYAHMEQ